MLNADPVIALLSRALDAAALRQTVHATNIANVNTEDYHRLEVIYSAEHAAPERRRPGDRCAGSAAMGAGGAGRSWSRPRATVRLDQEMAQMAENSVRYQALLGAIERTLGMLRTAARDGKE